MNPAEFEALQARRDQHAGPMTWKQIEDFLTWAEAQLPPEQQRNRPRRHPAAQQTPASLPLMAGGVSR